MEIIVIDCPVCNRFASLDGKYRRECLGRTIKPAAANGYRPHCSSCESMLIEARAEAERQEMNPGVPAWFAAEYP